MPQVAGVIRRYGARRKNLAARLSLTEKTGKKRVYKDGIRERQELR